MAMTDHEAGKLESVRELYEPALDILEESVGPDHPRISLPIAEIGLWISGSL